MEEVENGIYLYDGKMKSYSGKRPLVLVHPWFNEGHNKFREYGSSTNGNYLGNLEGLLRDSYDRDIFLFEESDDSDFGIKKLNEGLDRILALRGKSEGLYGICTYEEDPEPHISSWEEVMGFMRGFSDSLDLAGGKVLSFDLPESRGCLGYAKYMFDNFEFSTRLIRGCCFK